MNHLQNINNAEEHKQHLHIYYNPYAYFSQLSAPQTNQSPERNILLFDELIVALSVFTIMYLSKPKGDAYDVQINYSSYLSFHDSLFA